MNQEFLPRILFLKISNQVRIMIFQIPFQDTRFKEETGRDSRIKS